MDAVARRRGARLVFVPCRSDSAEGGAAASGRRVAAGRRDVELSGLDLAQDAARQPLCAPHVLGVGGTTCRSSSAARRPRPCVVPDGSLCRLRRGAVPSCKRRARLVRGAGGVQPGHPAGRTRRADARTACPVRGGGHDPRVRDLRPARDGGGGADCGSAPALRRAAAGARACGGTARRRVHTAHGGAPERGAGGHDGVALVSGPGVRAPPRSGP